MRVATAAVIGAAILLSASVAKIVWIAVSNAWSLVDNGLPAVLSTLRFSVFAITVNLVSFGGFLLVVLYENAASRRLREYRADAFAREIAGVLELPPVKPVEPRPALARFMRLFHSHPHPPDRVEALSGRLPIERATSGIYLVFGYVAGLLLELVLQLLFSSMLSPSAPLDAKRQQLAEFATAYPATFATCAIVYLAGVWVIGAVAIERVGSLSAPQERQSAWAPASGLTAAGFAIAFLCSQTVMYEFHQSASWAAFASAVADRLLLYATSLLGALAALVRACVHNGRGGPLARVLLPSIMPLSTAAVFLALYR